MRIALTGGGGFLGRAICRAWMERGVPAADLVVVSRKRHSLLDELGVAHAVASVTDGEALRRAFSGIDVVYHLAGLVSRDPGDAELLRSVHVDGTKNVLAVARELGVQRVVYASSTGTFGCTRDPLSAPHEDGPDCMGLVGHWAYYATKTAAEREAISAHEEHGQPVIVLNPSLLLGPGDVDGSSTTDVADFLAGRMPVAARGGVNFVDVRDAALAFVAAAERGQPGVRHLLGATNLTIREMLDQLAALSGQPAPRWSPPAWLQVALARAASVGARAVGRRPAVDPETAAMGQLFWYAQGNRATQTLGFEPRSPTETLRDTIADLRSRS